MKNIVLGIVSAITLGMVAQASAADLAARPYTKAPPLVATVYNWTGFYIGANGGGAFDNPSGTLVASTPLFAQAIAAGGTPGNLNSRHEGYFGGGQIGYNWQFSNFLLGLEADFQGADIGRTSSVTFGGSGGIFPSVSTGRDHLDWFGTVRGRAGVTYGQVLFYGTGGFAYANIRTSATNVFTPGTSGTFSGSTETTRAGWVAGGGIEWAFAPNWSIKGEYLHLDFGSSGVAIFDPVSFPTENATYNFRHTVDTARVGINYKWGGPVVARY